MLAKDFWARIKGWIAREQGIAECAATVGDNGLISPEHDSPAETADAPAEQARQITVKKVQPADKTQSLEKLQEGFHQLIENLKGINEHLNQQVTQQAQLTKRIDELPKLLESLPGVIGNQKQTVDQLVEQLKASAFKNQQFVEAVEKIPVETGKQTDLLVDITHQLSAAAESDVSMRESFNRFNEALGKLDQSTTGQTDGIMRMSKTFAASDRYMKYLVSKQSRRFMWVFCTAIGVCLFAIFVLVVIVAMLMKQ